MSDDLRCLKKKSILDFSGLGEHLRVKSEKLVLLLAADGCRVREDALPIRNRCRRLGKLVRLLSQRHPPKKNKNKNM